MSLLCVLVLIGVLAAAYSSPRKSRSTALDGMLLIDGHNDLALNIELLLKNDVDHLDLRRDLREDPVWRSCSTCQTDLPRLRAGKVGAQIWAAYVVCTNDTKDTVKRTIDQIDVLKRFVEMYPEDFQLAESAEDLEEAFRAGKIGSLIGVEGGHTIDSSLSILRAYHQMGVRCMALTHNCNTPWASAAGYPGGLTSFGRSVVREMNRIGMVVDLSYASHQTRMDALEESAAPVVFTRTAAAAICNRPSNVPDDILRQVAKTGGVVMVAFTSWMVNCGKEPATIDHVVAHINHIRTVAGVDHVGIGSGFDAPAGTPAGLEDVSHFPDLFHKLKNTAAGHKWSEEDLRKLAGQNFLRVFRKVKEVHQSMMAYRTKRQMPDTTELTDRKAE